MRPYALIVDDFLADFTVARRFIECAADFQSVHNPADALTYPGICELDPNALTGAEVASRLARILGSRVALKTLVLRLSLQGVPQPYSVHTDAFMGGQFTAVCYLNRPEQCQGGTEFLRHRASGLECAESSDPLPAELMRDTNNARAWEVTLSVPMAPNRVVIFPSERIHRAAPAAGFGQGVVDGRVVMAAVFDLRPHP